MKIDNRKIQIVDVPPRAAPVLHGNRGTPTGDTQGRVEAVAVEHNYQRGYNSFVIYVADIENDRFGCFAANGYIRVKDSGIGVDQNNFKQLFAVALAAHAARATIALSSSGTDPCNNVNRAWMLN